VTPESSKIRRGIAWTSIGNASAQAVSFAVGVVLARLLAPADFGILATIAVFTGIAGLFASGGMGDALIRAKDVSDTDFNVAFTIQLGIGLGLYSIFYLASPLIGASYNDSSYTDLIRVSAISFLIRPLLLTHGSLISRAMNYRTLSAINLGVLLCSSLVSIFLALNHFGVWSLILGGIAGAFVNVAMLRLNTKWRPQLSFEFARARHLARYGALMSAGDLLVYIRNQSSNLILSRAFDPHVVGIFNKAFQFAQIPHSLITNPVYVVTFRALSAAQDDLNACQYIALKALAMVLFYCIPPFMVVAWFAEPIINILYGERWLDSASLLTIFAVTAPIAAIANVAGCVLAARNWLARELPVQLIQATMSITFVLYALNHGLRSVAIAICLANVYSCIHLGSLAVRSLSISWRILRDALIPPFAYGAGLIIFWSAIEATWPRNTWSSDYLYIATFVPFGGLVYLILFLLFPGQFLAGEKKRLLAVMTWFRAPRSLG
jgi:teichuronic acid exporter